MNNKKTSYKLLSLDLDGTLLSPVLRKAKKADCLALQDFMSVGGIPFINTGRPPWSVEKIIEKINNAGSHKIQFIASLNGSYIKDFNDGKVVHTTISHEYCSKILEIVKRHRGANIWMFTPKCLEDKSVFVYPMNYIYRIGYRLARMKRITDTSDLKSFKIDIISPRKSVIAGVYRDLVANNMHNVVTISHSSPRLIEITASHVNKGYAVSYFARKYKIPKNEIISMGDSFNDLSGFRTSALSIGIHPKNLNFLRYCDEITDHKSQGVKQAIYDYVIKDVDDETFKLIFADLDGTLIDNKTKLFSRQTKLALQQCTNHLIPIAIASGRSIHDGVRIVESMELNPKTNIYVIGNNGATIFDIYTKKYISQSPIADKDARKIFNVLIDYAKKEKNNLGFIVYQHSIDLLFYNESFWKPFNFKKTGSEYKYDPWMKTRPIYITEYPKDIICYKFVVKFPNPERALKGCKELRRIFPNLEVCLSSSVNLEINRKGINKGFAAKKLLGIIKVDPDHTLVLGDGQNDIPALKLSKHSFVPSYSPDYVQKEARHIIRGVDVTNFASTVIDQYVLKKGTGK